MFSWIWRWARPVAPAGTPSAVTPSADHTHNTRGAKANANTEVSSANVLFFEQRARDLPNVAAVPEADEPAISALVMDAVAYLEKKRVEPPVMPALVPRILGIVNQANVDLVRLTDVITQDLAISSKLLNVANSPVFGANTEIRSVRQAVAYLGTEQVAQVAIGLACASTFESSAGASSAFAQRWTSLFRHGMTCALTAAHLASKSVRTTEDSAFMAGLFHDVVKAVALRALENLHKVGRLDGLSDAIVDEALHRIHAYPGDEFFAKWTLPDALMSLCAQHHQLEDVEDAGEVFYFVSLASSFDALLNGCDAERRNALEEARTSADRLGLSEEALHATYLQTRAFAERAARLIGRA